jgi:hypothetical protein
MVNVSVRPSRRAGVTAVHVVVENHSSERRRVRLAVACDAAVWPPRRRGVPEAGWDADGVTLTVAAGGVRGVGFATPAADVDVELVESTPRGGAAARGGVAGRDHTTDAEATDGPDGRRGDDGDGGQGVGGSARVDGDGGQGVGDSARVDGVVRALGSFAPPLAATPREDAADAPRSGEPGEGGGA